ncbi:MAG: cob(I)yrinic acid a,c-diamide adenosyltransferase [Paludibacteraceae bacterium]
MKIYTKTGDNGTTSLVGGQRIAKNAPRLHAYGTIDELNSFLGLLKVKIDDDKWYPVIHDIQNTLLCVGANLATDPATTSLHESAKISAQKTQQLEQYIDEIDQNLPKLTQFIIYGDNEPSALCHICRAIVRRAERHILDIDNQDFTNSEVIKYINRLSDFLFVLARYLATKNTKNEIFWTKS